MHCTILKKTYIFVLSIRKKINIPQNKRFAASNIMKKLLLLFAVGLISLNSMAMGFPQNTYSQQRALNKNLHTIAFKTPLQTLEVGLKDTLENIKKSDGSTQKSFVEMVVNYVVHFFAEKIIEQKSIFTKYFDGHKLDCVTVKNEFEYCSIG